MIFLEILSPEKMMQYSEDDEPEFIDIDFEAFNRFKEANDLSSFWAIYGVKLEDKSSMSPGAIIHNPHYGTRAIVGGIGSWGDVYKACDRVVVESGDLRRNCIECFTELEDGIYSVSLSS